MSFTNLRRCSLLLAAVLALAAKDGSTPLHDAVWSDDPARVSALIRDGADVKAINRYGITPLSLACTNGNTEIVKVLLKAGADPNAAAPGGETVLMTAARTGNADLVKALLVAGANVHGKESLKGQSAIMWAAAEGHAKVVELLIEYGADFRARLDSGFTPLLFSARDGKTDVVRMLLKAGSDPNDSIRPAAGTTRTGGAPRAGTSALHLSVGNAHFELATMLLQAGANPNAADNGWTALHAITGVRKPGLGDNNPAPYGSGSMTSIQMVRKLKEHGADLNARMTKHIPVGLTRLNTIGATPFLLAARSADAELMRELAQLGADPLIPNADKSTPLMAAAGLGTRSPGEDAGTESEVVEAIQVALELGNNIDAVDNNGETAMHSAAYKNLPGAVEILAKKGAKIEVWNRNNKFGWTPLRIAEGYRFGNYKPSVVTVKAIQEVLKEAGVEPAESAGGNRP